MPRFLKDYLLLEGSLDFYNPSELTAPEGRHFFNILGIKLIVKRTFVISFSSIVSFELTFTFWEGMRMEIILKLFQS